MGNNRLKQEDHCFECLRNIKGVCTAFKNKQWPCWAFINDKAEYEIRERERKNYLEKHDIA